MANDDFVTGAELSRWMTEQSDFRARLETRIYQQHHEVVASLRRIEDQVRETNGRTQRAEQSIASILPRLAQIELDDEKIDVAVRSIKEEGCSQLSAHAQTLELIRPGVDGWTRQKKVVVGGALVGGGVAIWPAVRDLIGLARELVLHFTHGAT